MNKENRQYKCLKVVFEVSFFVVNPVVEYGLLLQLVLRKRRPLSTTLTDRPKLYRLDKLKTLFIKYILKFATTQIKMEIISSIFYSHSLLWTVKIMFY